MRKEENWGSGVSFALPMGVRIPVHINLGKWNKGERFGHIITLPLVAPAPCSGFVLYQVLQAIGLFRIPGHTAGNW